MMNKRGFLRKFLSLPAKLLIISVLFFGGVYAFELLNQLHLSSHGLTASVNADGPINVWWPTDGAKVSDTQTFKAMVQDHSLSDYNMTWSVDGGQQNQMYDSQTDYPHKEAVVDLKNWTWHGSGPYKVTFTAADHSGQALGEMSINIYTPAPAEGPTTVVTGVTQAVNAVANAASVPTAAATETSQPSPSPTPTPSSTPTPTPTPTPVVNPADVFVSHGINVWWPTNNTTVTGVQTVKAVVDGVAPDEYGMYWQVDNGQLNPMWDNASDVPHKQADIDFTSWHWHGNGPYTLTILAKNHDGTQIARQDIQIYTGGVSNQTSQALSSPVQITDVQPQATTQSSAPTVKAASAALVPQVQTPTVSNMGGNGSNPFAGAKLYLDPNSDAKHTADSWQSSRPDDAYQMDKIANTPQAVWLGDWNNDVGSYVSQKMQEAGSQGAMQTFIAYNIPGRDCGQYSAGGANGASTYHNWISAIANGIGSGKAVVVLEPDAIALTDCLSGQQLSDRYSMLQDAVATLKSKSNIHVYIDAGHPNWISASDMASRLTKAGVNQADGFALNVSNFYTTQDNESYGNQISSQIGGKHFVIDTGRNGLGPTSDQQWCNPPGRALGAKPTADTGDSNVDAFLWLKGPGGSDGNCNGGPSAGVWWPDYALDLAKHAAY